MSFNSVDKIERNDQRDETPIQSAPSQTSPQASAVDGGLKAWSTVAGCFLAFLRRSASSQLSESFKLSMNLSYRITVLLKLVGSDRFSSGALPVWRFLAS